jgi:hypothetical protein
VGKEEQVKLDQFFDHESKKTKYRIQCGLCDKQYHICTSPRAAEAAAIRKGWDSESGLCRVCHLMGRMKQRTESVSA